jgi:aryl-alcohol dehydrogenase-like predicted oxidoreductase
MPYQTQEKLSFDPDRVTPGQIALAWLLKKSPVILAIPGTSVVNRAAFPFRRN